MAVRELPSADLCRVEGSSVHQRRIAVTSCAHWRDAKRAHRISREMLQGVAAWRKLICTQVPDSTIFSRTNECLDEVQAKARKRALTEPFEESIEDAKLTKLEMARKMATSRSQLDRVLDPENVSVQLDTLSKAARAIGGRSRPRSSGVTKGAA
jgi:antitoxin HicB